MSFSLGQVETEGQWLTLMDSLKTITDDYKNPANNMTFDDVIFVIEELDTDPRGLCIQREREEIVQVEEPEDSEDEEDNNKKGRGKGKKKGKKQEDSGNSDPPLSLGAILRQLDGGYV